MILWLWDVYGQSGNGRGITDDETAAVRAAEAFMRDHGGTTATVEAAHLMIGMELTFKYFRVGRGQAASRNGTNVHWEPLTL